MKLKYYILLAFFTLLAMALLAQAATTHSVTLQWSDTVNPTGTTYNVYRATGLCSGTPSFSKLATGVAVTNYVDTTVTPGNYCYQVTASLNGMESSPSNSVLAPVPPFAPSALTFTVQ